MGLFSKPNVEPPPGLPDPDFNAFDDLIEKYQNEYETNLLADRLSDIVRIKEAMDDLFEIEFGGIRHFLQSTKTSDEQAEIARFRNMFNSVATSSSWMIGREWASRDTLLRKHLEQRHKVDTDVIPSDAMILLNKAVYLPYWLFASVMSEYYDSEYGARTRHQKEAHLKSTYQSLMKGVLMCFLAGVKFDSPMDNNTAISIGKVENRAETRPDERETNWPPLAAGVLAVIAGLLAEIGWGDFLLIRALFAALGVFVGWWPALALLQVIIVKVRGKSLRTALGDGIRSNYLLLIALLIVTNLIQFRYLQSGDIINAVFGALVNGSLWYTVMYVVRWAFRKLFFRSVTTSRPLVEQSKQDSTKIQQTDIDRFHKKEVILLIPFLLVLAIIIGIAWVNSVNKPVQADQHPIIMPTSRPTAIPTPTKRLTPTIRSVMLTVTAIVARDKANNSGDCELWSNITLADKGKTLCVYGTAKSTYHREDVFYVTFGNENSDFYFVSYGEFWYDEMKGNCVMAEGEVEQIASAPVIVVPLNQFYHCELP